MKEPSNLEQCLAGAERIIHKTFEQKDGENFLIYARKSLEGMLTYVLLKEKKIQSFRGVFNLYDLREKTNFPEKADINIAQVQMYGNIGAHYSVGKISTRDVEPCKIALSRFIFYFYKEVLEKDMPKSIFEKLLVNPPGKLRFGKSKTPKVTESIWKVINALRYNPISFPGKLYEMLQQIYAHILIKNEKLVPGELARGKNNVDFNEANRYCFEKGYIGALDSIHFRILGSYSLDGLKSGSQAYKNVISVINPMVLVIHWFYENYADAMPAEINNALNVSVENQRNEKDETSEKPVTGWLIRVDDNQSMVFSVYEGENLIGRQNTYREKTTKIIINSMEISRQHARITSVLEEGEFKHYLEDTQPSTNGTYLNSDAERIGADSKVLLNDGDLIRLGQDTAKLLFKIGFTDPTSAEDDAIDTIQWSSDDLANNT